KTRQTPPATAARKTGPRVKPCSVVKSFGTSRSSATSTFVGLGTAQRVHICRDRSDLIGGKVRAAHRRHRGGRLFRIWDALLHGVYDEAKAAVAVEPLAS